MDDSFKVICCPKPNLLLFAHSSQGCSVSTLMTPLSTISLRVCLRICSRACNPNFEGVEKHVHRVPSYDSTIVKVGIFLEVTEMLRRTMVLLSLSLICLQNQEWKARQVLSRGGGGGDEAKVTVMVYMISS